MKQKLSTRIDDKIMRAAKRKAAEEGRTLSNLTQEAIEQYLRQHYTALGKEREAAFHLFCERPMSISKAQLRYLLNEDM